MKTELRAEEDARLRTGINQDLGLGGKMAERASIRLLNQDGTFNALRLSQHALHPLNLYHTLIQLPPWKLLLTSLGVYVVVNLLFATMYWLAGPQAIDFQGHEQMSRFESCFYFSVQTIGTIGYGRMVPVSRAANILVALEALVGLIGFAVLSALLYARLTRPRGEIVFSRQALIAPYQDGWGLMIRMANRRRSDLTEARATLTIGRWVNGPFGIRKRQFDFLDLERPNIVFMPLHWVIVHPIDAASPLKGMSKEDFEKSEPEIFLLITADDETFSMTVHSRTSYRREDVRWGYAFKDMYVSHPSKVVVDLALIHDTTPISGPLPGHL